MRTTGREELAWAAGFFEAAGVVTEEGRLTVRSARGDCVTRFAAAVGHRETTTGPGFWFGGSGRHAFLVWVSPTGAEAAVLGLLWPWLSEETRALVSEQRSKNVVVKTPNGVR